MSKGRVDQSVHEGVSKVENGMLCKWYSNTRLGRSIYMNCSEPARRICPSETALSYLTSSRPIRIRTQYCIAYYTKVVGPWDSRMWSLVLLCIRVGSF